MLIVYADRRATRPRDLQCKPAVIVLMPHRRIGFGASPSSCFAADESTISWVSVSLVIGRDLRFSPAGIRKACTAPSPCCTRQQRATTTTEVRLEQSAGVFSLVPASVHDERGIRQCSRIKDQRLDVNQGFERVLRELSVCAVAARANAIFRRGAISPVRSVTNSVENSSIAASRSGPHHACSVRRTSPVECAGKAEKCRLEGVYINRPLLVGGSSNSEVLTSPPASPLHHDPSIGFGRRNAL